MLTESRTYWRSWISFSCWALQFDNCFYFLCHNLHLLYLLNLVKFNFNRCFPAEHCEKNFYFVSFYIDYNTFKSFKWSLCNFYKLTRRNIKINFSRFDKSHLSKNFIDFIIWKWNRSYSATNRTYKTSNARSISYYEPSIIIHNHLN